MQKSLLTTVGTMIFFAVMASGCAQPSETESEAGNVTPEAAELDLANAVSPCIENGTEVTSQETARDNTHAEEGC